MTQNRKKKRVLFLWVKLPDSDMDGDEDVLHADEEVDAPDAVV
jgi:hypothetical protein